MEKLHKLGLREAARRIRRQRRAADGAGSVVRPAAFCGVVGYKPSHGVISTGGVMPYAPTLDTVGVFARSVRDAALLASACAPAARPLPADADPCRRLPLGLQILGPDGRDDAVLAAGAWCERVFSFAGLCD